jgi:hypothetical protein
MLFFYTTHNNHVNKICKFLQDAYHKTTQNREQSGNINAVVILTLW